jgi:hypothetical protein
MKKVVLSLHAKQKFDVLRRHGFIISKESVIEAVKQPDKIDTGYGGRKIAQKILDADHLLRVIFEESKTYFKVVTFYPARRRRYESKL